MFLLELKGVTKFFGGLPAVINVDFSVRKGEIYRFNRAERRGKNHFIQCYQRLFSAHQRKSLFQGGGHYRPENCTRWRKKAWFRTFQHSKLFTELTVLENMLIGFHLNRKVNFWGGYLQYSCFETFKQQVETKGH